MNGSSVSSPSTSPSSSQSPNALPTSMIPLDLSTLWVEYKHNDGRVYFYNAKTRQTTWTRPEGQRVMSQDELDKLLASTTISNKTILSTPVETKVAPSEDNETSISTESKPHNPVPVNNDAVDSSENTNAMSKPSNAAETAAPAFNPYSYPPPFGMPWGAFPPHLMPHMAQMMQSGFPGFGSFPPAQMLRFMMPPFMNPSALGGTNAAVAGAKSLETLNSELKKLRVQLKEVENKMAQVNGEAAVWSEFKNPEGRAYYYNSKTTESTWDKPIVLNDVIDVQNQLEHINKSIHESEQEVKRLEIEQVQLAAVNSMTSNTSTDKQPTTTTPGFINGFTLEKMDTNEIRRLGESSMGPDERRTFNDDKTKGKPKPVSSTPVPGTPWCVVWTSDGGVFFFNPTSRKSQWDRPEDLKGRPEVDEMVRRVPGKDDAARPGIVSKKKLDGNADENEPDAKKAKSEQTTQQAVAALSLSADGNEQSMNDDDDETSQDAPETQTTGSTSSTNALIPPPTNESQSTPKKDRSGASREAFEAEAKAARQRELVPYETRVKQFREMLAEKEVSAFTTWERELNKIVFDPRYLLLTAKERKQEFDRYTHERADDERREKAAKLKLKKKQFRDLLEDSSINIRTTFNEFSSRHAKDERFRAIEKTRDREAWYQEYIVELKTRDKEGRHSDKEKLKKDFFALLKELKITRHSSWSETKRLADHDPRYKAVESSSKREDWFRDYQTNSTVENNEEDLERQREKEKQDRIDASIKKRVEEVKEQLSGFQRELDKEREQLKKDKATENFKALLTDMVRIPDVEWKETKKTLRKDPRWEQDLERDEKETLFKEHLHLLDKKRKTAFHALLSESCTLSSTWKEVKKIVKTDPRFDKIFTGGSERKRDLEKEFEVYIKDKYHAAKGEFKELLKETKLITHKSLQTVRESEEQSHLRDIEKILQKDKRYLSLDVVPEERSKILWNYLEELEQRGAPPPPTASLDRRKL